VSASTGATAKGSGANSRDEQKRFPFAAVETSSPKHRVPDLRRSLALNASQSELSLPDAVQELDAGDRYRRIPKFLEAEHHSNALSHPDGPA
jgi:hypothetical protein